LLSAAAQSPRYNRSPPQSVLECRNGRILGHSTVQPKALAASTHMLPSTAHPEGMPLNTNMHADTRTHTSIHTPTATHTLADSTACAHRHSCALALLASPCSHLYKFAYRNIEKKSSAERAASTCRQNSWCFLFMFELRRSVAEAEGWSLHALAGEEMSVELCLEQQLLGQHKKDMQR